MSFISILETLLIGPLKLLFEIIFRLANEFVNHPGFSIIVLSLIMNILVLPLYRRADAMQEQARDTENKLHKGVSHIKKSFSGDEKMMILQTYYRQNHYKPTDALNGSVSLLLEIPFFMAAYQFLSHLDILQGASLGPIKDLSLPDGLLVIGGLSINILPILMTVINVISCVIYLKGFPLKSKIQLYGMALFFLVFLYTSPAGLVFYWTLNNVFSLVKTIFYKIRNPKLMLRILTTVLGLAFMVFGGFIYETDEIQKRIVLIAIGVLLLLPMLVPIVKSKLPEKEKKADPTPNRKLFFMGGLFLTFLIGLLIPSTFIAASPQEYVDISYFHNPLWYIVSAFCMAAGFFLVWLGVFYWLATPKGKVIFCRLIWILCGVTLVNYLFFGTKLGLLSPSLQYENGVAFTLPQQLINIGIVAVLALALYFLIVKWQKAISIVLITAIAAVGIMSTVHIVTIQYSVGPLSSYQSQGEPNFKLSKNGKNVVVIMLDRAMGLYVPYMFNEKPELEEKFAGFTYYTNTISHGGTTNFGSPGLVGGYEYTPVEMNKRDDEKLVDKHNEALKVMPVLFDKNDFDVTLFDPVYANYQWIPDTSIYDEYPDIKAFLTEGIYNDPKPIQQMIANNHRNFFCFSLMKTMPLFMQSAMYDNGLYNQIEGVKAENLYTNQIYENEDSTTVAKGYSKPFMDAYNVLTNLSTMSDITDSDNNTFMFMTNNATHEPVLLQEPEYEPSYYVDNTEYDEANPHRYDADGNKLKMNQLLYKTHYQTNMAAMLQLGKWFDYLRENDVYDNTRIILVSDHGRNLYQSGALSFEHENMAAYYPLLMVKDFNSREFTTSYDFMTNADVPTLATNGIIENPINPFTGKEINSDEKTAHDQYIICSSIWDVNKNDGNTFLPSEWASVKDDLWNKNNWKFYFEEVVLKEHSFPD